jgi:hypothetical protein
MLPKDLEDKDIVLKIPKARAWFVNNNDGSNSKGEAIISANRPDLEEDSFSVPSEPLLEVGSAAR